LITNIYNNYVKIKPNFNTGTSKKACYVQNWIYVPPYANISKYTPLLKIQHHTFTTGTEVQQDIWEDTASVEKLEVQR
jgi:hypothetical protein